MPICAERTGNQYFGRGIPTVKHPVDHHPFISPEHLLQNFLLGLTECDLRIFYLDRNANGNELLLLGPIRGHHFQPIKVDFHAVHDTPGQAVTFTKNRQQQITFRSMRTAFLLGKFSC